MHLAKPETTRQHKSRIVAATAKCVLYFIATKMCTFQKSRQSGSTKSSFSSRIAKCLVCRHKIQPSRSQDNVAARKSDCGSDCRMLTLLPKTRALYRSRDKVAAQSPVMAAIAKCSRKRAHCRSRNKVAAQKSNCRNEC